jgi:hypothetical protein
VNIEMNGAQVPALEVQTFAATPNPARAGQRVTLSWSVAGASEVVISPSIGTVTPQGNRVVTLHNDMEFTLVAKSAYGPAVTRTVNVLVAGGGASEPAQTQQARVNTPPVPAPAQPAQPTQYQTPPPQYQTPPPQPVQQQVRASPVMNVYHDHGLIGGNQYTWPNCWGQLQIGGGRVVFRVLGTTDGRRDGFVVAASAVTDVAVNRLPIRGRQAFHMRVNGQNFNFIPAAGAPLLYVNVIQQWLQAK